MCGQAKIGHAQRSGVLEEIDVVVDFGGYLLAGFWCCRRGEGSAHHAGFAGRGVHGHLGYLGRRGVDRGWAVNRGRFMDGGGGTDRCLIRAAVA